MNFADVKSLSIPNGEVIQIQQLPNLIASSIDSDGSIYNDCGYLDGYRLSSSGTIKPMASEYYESTVTGYIQVVDGDILYIEGCNWFNLNSALNYICGYDAEFNFIGAEYSQNVNNNICYGTKFVDHVTGNKRHARAVLMPGKNVAYVRVSCTTALVGQTISGAHILVSTLSKALTVWKKYSYTNQVPISIDTDGSIYNGVGYKDDYRIRSGGGYAAQVGARHTGYIPAVAGDIIRLSGWNFNHSSASNAINFSNAEFTSIGQFTTQPASYGIILGNPPDVTVADDVYEFTVPDNSDITYIRVTGMHDYQVLPPSMIVTVNEEIK